MSHDDENDRAAAVPADPRQNPEQAVDALEESVLGDHGDHSPDEDSEDEAVVDQDLDPEDLSDPDAGPDASE